MAQTEHNDGPQAALIVICVSAVVFTVALVLRGSTAYADVLGISHPVVPAIVVAALGFFGVRFIERCELSARAMVFYEGWPVAIVMGLLLPIPVIIVDLFGGFGRDINAPFPDALLFYPAVALLAEMVFHVAPLCVAAGITALSKRTGRGPLVIGYAIAVLIEPILQIAWAAESSPNWANAYVAVHLLAFNVLAVYLIRRSGFVSAYVFRIAYYAVWHLGWGYLRLDVFLPL